MVIKEAIPTEYKGVRYDSKSEAVFAYLLDKCRDIDHKYSHLPIGGHNWDFVCWQTATYQMIDDDGDEWRSPYVPVAPLLIEYKPRKPTETYISNLRTCAYNAKNNFSLSGAFSAFIVYGSAWEGDFFAKDLAFTEVESPWVHLWDESVAGGKFGVFGVDGFLREAKKYRYDLA